MSILMPHIDWVLFPVFAGCSFLCWIGAAALCVPTGRLNTAFTNRLTTWLHIVGAASPTLFAVLLWISLGRPPLKTLGETRLWYAVFLPWIGLLVQARWSMRWLNQYCVAMAALFLVLNLIRPDAHDTTLMPALQSPWFVPHVIVYIVAYALLGASFLVGLHGLYQIARGRDTAPQVWLADHCVLIGFVFLTFGLLFGGIWAKEAWGHYWTWDPKETWSLLTWLIYLVYLHTMHHRRPSPRGTFALLVAAFCLLLVCWFGVNYLPSAASSVHTYSG